MPRFQGCALGPSMTEQKLGAETEGATKRYRGGERKRTRQRQTQTQKETAAKVMSIRKAERR